MTNIEKAMKQDMAQLNQMAQEQGASDHKPVVMAGPIRARAEAVAMILQLDPETAFDDCFDSYAIGDTGDYGTSWNERKLKQLFGVNGEHESSPFAKLAASVEEMYWTQVAKRDDISTFQGLVKRLIQQVENDKIDKSVHSPLELLKGWCEWKP